MKNIFRVIFLSVLALSLLGGCTASLLENEYESSEVIEVVTIESLNIQLKYLSKSMSDYKSKINLLASYIIEMQNKVNALDDQGAYSEIKSKVDEMDGKVTAFEDALKNLEGFTDVNTWVSDLNAGLNSLSALQEAVNDAKDGITGIVTRLNGLDETTAGIASELSTKTEALLAGLESCSADISGILTRLGALEGNVAALQAEIAALIASVQSVVVVPDYSDGSVRLTNLDDNIVRFEVQPLSSAQRLVEIGQSAFSFDYVETTTKAAALHHLPITAVSFDGEFVSVTVDGTTIPEMTNLSENSINARLLISDGEIVRGSEYFPATVTIIAPPEPTGITDLSINGTANCYVVSSIGAYKFKGNVKGNSSTVLDGTPVKAELLWETFGTDVTPTVNDVIASVSYKDGYIEFDTPETLKNGNAVIAAKDAAGNILWSWHIWVCKDFDPVATGQEYYNDAGTMMDRNLGATSATPGDVGALGLLYQWGRKDPFLTGDSISSITRAKSTLSSWPSPVTSDSSKGTIAYAVKNPTTFIGGVSGTSYDWRFSSRDNTLWQSSKTIYDPCPPGWRVPDGGSSGVWSKAANTSSSFSHTWDSTNKGMNFSNKFGSAGTIWYPAAGWLDDGDGSLYGVGNSGYWWSCTPNVSLAYYLSLNRNGDVYPSGGSSRAFGLSVRCQKEGTGGGEVTPAIDFSTATNLSSDGTANCYVVSAAGTYKFSSVQGNSSTSVGSVSSVEVLWESFGTEVVPSVGDIIADVAFADGFVGFKTPATLKNGNAVIAAKDAGGEILWSWHIWVCKDFDPVATGQEYYNNAGTMMDRNLGATSATPGDVGALGLLYQWGRKDPFLGSSSISSNSKAKSTLSWPAPVSSTSNTGKVDYAVKNPTTFIKGVSGTNYDWVYSSRDNTLWQSAKTIYDPCPPGWRVPDGGSSGVWSKAVNSSSDFPYDWDFTNRGMNFSGKFGSAGTIWYPAAGYLLYDDGSLDDVGYYGSWWSCTPNGSRAGSLLLYSNGNVYPSDGSNRAGGRSVRCLQE